MPEITHRTVDVGGISLHLAESGPADGPVVLLLHGFPECWYSWRHQLDALAAAGYHAVAPDQRGYGSSDAPTPIDAYTVLHLVGDAIGVLDAVGAARAVVVGHDWGAPVAWHTALLRPDRVRGVLALSVPLDRRSQRPPTEAIAHRFGPHHYMLHFQEPGLADAELAADPRGFLRRMLTATSGSGTPSAPTAEGGFVAGMPEPASLPDWLTEHDLDVYTAAFAEHGFTGGLNWYRNLDRNWALTAAWRGALVTPPARYLAGEFDLVVGGRTADQLAETMAHTVADLRGVTLLPGCGHWTQQERPDEVNSALLAFAASLG
ncbi:alpha/beta fold hydrolase [Pseudonocardia sp. CA-107938]|uniref:alpha/beta fold hydrolase n=1 Tax=Pseudonocardia sp. CA-107938 TaxID=3240021 RepID=UPI003D91BBCB